MLKRITNVNLLKYGKLYRISSNHEEFFISVLVGESDKIVSYAAVSESLYVLLHEVKINYNPSINKEYLDFYYYYNNKLYYVSDLKEHFFSTLIIEELDY